MTSGKQPHILNASSNLLGICFVLITGLKISHLSQNTIADEISFFSAFCLLGSCVLSYFSLRKSGVISLYQERAADYLFMAGMFSLFFAVFILAFNFL